MSQENVELVRRWKAAYNQRYFDTVLRLTDPDGEFRSIFVGIESIFRGHDDVRTYFEQIDDAYDRFQVVPERFVDVWSFRGGKVIRLENFVERSEALEAAGLSE